MISYVRCDLRRKTRIHSNASYAPHASDTTDATVSVSIHGMASDDAVITHLLRKAFAHGKAVLVTNVDGMHVAQNVASHGWASVLEDRPDRVEEESA